MSWEPLNLGAPEFAIRPEPPRWCGLIYDGKRHLVSGPPESAKTMFAWIVALTAIRDGAPVAAIDFESGPGASRLMLDELGATPEELAALDYYEPDCAPDLTDLQRIIDAGTRLAIIDAAAGAYDLSGLDDNARKDAERFAALWVRPLWQAGVTTLLIDHVTKNRDTRSKFAIGSERKLGGVDVHIGMEDVQTLSRGGSGIVKLTAHKDRPGFLRGAGPVELHLDSDADTHALTWEFHEGTTSASTNGFRPTVLMDRVLEHVAQPWYEPATRTALAKQVRGKYAAVLTGIDVLLADGSLALDGKRIVPCSGNVPGNGNKP